MIYYSKDFVLHASYYMFNMLKVVTALIVFYCNRIALARTTRRAFFALLIIQAAWVAIVGNNMWGRAIGTFNDPNQLGYWTLLTAVCIFALRPDRTLRFIDLGSLLLAFYIILMTVSRSSMLAFACLLVIVIGFSQIRFRTFVVILLAVLMVAAILHYYAGIEQYYQDAITFLEKRAKSRTNQFDSLSKRSIERIWLFPQYLFLGSGEGEYMLRFKIRNEAHSSLIAILFCYGIVGFTAFWSLVFVFLRQADWFRMMLFVPPMVYGLANQGVRFSLFWIFLAFVFAMSQPTEAEIDGRSRAAS
jgi:hypothetical protein